MIHLKHSFYDEMAKWDWEVVTQQIAQTTPAQVERALSRAGKGGPQDFMALVSPAARSYLPRMAELAQSLTQKRFGKTIQLYAPLYLSNECENICTYCGFSKDNPMARVTLNRKQVEQECMYLKAKGFEHILLVTGESPARVGVDYLVEAVEWVRPFFAQISLEVQPLDALEYQRLIAAGVSAVYVYQETYHKENYKQYHPKGKKSIFRYRVETPDRLGEAGMRKMGLGVLLGLESWATDAFFCALHLHYLQKQYWRTKFSLSFPRMRPHAGSDYVGNVQVSEKDLVQLILAFRIFNEDVELSLSTRESPYFRNSMLPYGVTHMSAGSRTDPGGYTVFKTELQQFNTHDNREAVDMSSVIRSLGYETIWKDWEPVFDVVDL
jgi:2-iminoacetate synthase